MRWMRYFVPIVVFLVLMPSLASAAGTVRIQRAYVKLFDHLLYLYVRPRILGHHLPR